MIVFLCITKSKKKKKKKKMSKVQGFMFVSKTIYNKPCTTNQKPRKLKQKKRIEDMKFKKLKNENKQREKYLLKKYRFSIIDS